MKMHEIRALSPKEIRQKLDEAHREHFDLRFQFSIGQLANYNRLTEVQRNIARLKTVLREKELQALWEEEVA
jgi:large subunit ribosomal protein L29